MVEIVSIFMVGLMRGLSTLPTRELYRGFQEFAFFCSLVAVLISHGGHVPLAGTKKHEKIRVSFGEFQKGTLGVTAGGVWILSAHGRSWLQAELVGVKHR